MSDNPRDGDAERLAHAIKTRILNISVHDSSVIGFPTSLQNRIGPALLDRIAREAALAALADRAP